MGKLTTYEFIGKAKLVHGDNYDYSLSNYINCDTKLTIICQIHGDFKITPYHFINRKQGCYNCGLINGHNKRIKTNKQIIEEFNKVRGDYYDYSRVNYVNCKIKVKIICPEHGEFEQTPDNHLNNKHSCPRHHEPKSEKIIREYLIENNYKYITQKKFIGCRNIKPLVFDFYLPDYNVCIEYNGEQHYKSVKYWGGEEGLLDRQKKDNIKIDYCKNNNIMLLIIKYNENIIDKLTSMLNQI